MQEDDAHIMNSFSAVADLGEGGSKSGHGPSSSLAMDKLWLPPTKTLITCQFLPQLNIWIRHMMCPLPIQISGSATGPPYRLTLDCLNSVIDLYAERHTAV